MQKGSAPRFSRREFSLMAHYKPRQLIRLAAAGVIHPARDERGQLSYSLADLAAVQAYRRAGGGRRPYRRRKEG